MAVMGKKESGEETEQKVAVVDGEKKAEEETKPVGGEGAVMEKEVAVVDGEKKPEEETKPAGKDALVLDTTKDYPKQFADNDADADVDSIKSGGENLANNTSSGALMEKKENGEEMGEKKPEEETKPAGEDASVLDTTDDNLKHFAYPSWESVKYLADTADGYTDWEIVKNKRRSARGLAKKTSPFLMGTLLGNRFAALAVGDGDGDDGLEGDRIDGVEGNLKTQARRIYVYLREAGLPFPPFPIKTRSDAKHAAAAAKTGWYANHMIYHGSFGEGAQLEY